MEEEKDATSTKQCLLELIAKAASVKGARQERGEFHGPGIGVVFHLYFHWRCVRPISIGDKIDSVLHEGQHTRARGLVSEQAQNTTEREGTLLSW